MNKSRDLAHAEAEELRLLQRIHVADVVVVQSYDAGKARVTVKPLVHKTVNGSKVSPPPLLSVPVISVPEITSPDATINIREIAPGDIGVVLYLDIDSDNAIKTGSEGTPNSSRVHAVDDAVFLGIIRKG